MGFIDMHCDTLMKLAFLEGENNLFQNDNTAVDFKRLQESGAIAQFFAIFMPDEETYKYFNKKTMKDKEYFNLLFRIYLKNLKENSDIIKPAHSAKDLEENIKKGKISSILTMEDGRMINNDFDIMDELYDLGIRAITLTWNSPNCFGFPHAKGVDEMKRGLTNFGKEAIEYMNEIGMLIDVSHLSDGGFWDVVNITKQPFIASHSNCRELSPHTRNMSDEMIRALGEKGGVMGLNFCPAFLNKDISSKEAKIETMVEHVKHMIDVGGVDVAALGSDFDGMRGKLEVSHCGEYGKLFDALKKAGFTENVIDKITHKNVIRVMKDTLW